MANTPGLFAWTDYFGFLSNRWVIGGFGLVILAAAIHAGIQAYREGREERPGHGEV